MSGGTRMKLNPKIDPESVSFGRSEAGLIDSLTLTQRDQCLQIRSQRIVFCAGEGNQRLIQQASLKTVVTQTRPLKMVIVSKSELPPVYVHCIGNNFSLTPKLTITSHVNSAGETVWYLGGEIAESGVAIADELQIKHAQRLIRELFSWVDFHGAHWQCLSINRAEANINNSYRPDDACYIEECNVISAWPTKLTLTPALADKLVEHFAAGSMKPLQYDNEMDLRSCLSRPQFAAAYWD